MSLFSLYNQKDSNDQKKNMLLQQRIKSFQWITLKHLELDISLENITVANLERRAIQGSIRNIFCFI